MGNCPFPKSLEFATRLGGTKVNPINLQGHIGQAKPEREVEELKSSEDQLSKKSNQRQPNLPLFDPQTIPETPSDSKTDETRQINIELGDLREEQRIIDGIGDVFGKLYKDLGFNNILRKTRKNTQWNAILKSCVLARVANPVSKRRTASMLEQDYGVRIPLEKIYRMMDHVADQEEDIKKSVAYTTRSILEEEFDVLFFDVTTLYFESVQSDELREFGFSKDCKFKETQVVLALVTTKQGLPVTYELFPGNIYEGATLIQMVQKLKKTYNINNILLVADRPCLPKRIYFSWISLEYLYRCRKIKTLPNKLKEEILESSELRAAVAGNELHWLKEFEHKNRRLIVSYTKNRALKDAKDRQRLIDRLMKKVKNGKIRIKDLIPNYGSKKFISIESGKAIVNEEKIEESARWDGLHGVITNSDKNPTDMLSRYRELWRIEEAFRISKHDLKMRPIYHWAPERIKAHIAICFLAFTLVKQALRRARIQYMPMSFEKLRNELLHAQSSIMYDIKSRIKFRLPSKVTKNQRRIYQVFGLKRLAIPQILK